MLLSILTVVGDATVVVNRRGGSMWVHDIPRQRELAPIVWAFGLFWVSVNGSLAQNAPVAPADQTVSADGAREVLAAPAASPTKEAGQADRDDSPASVSVALMNEQLRIAEQLARDFPRDFDAHRILGVAHRYHGNYEAMNQAWLRCRELNPQRADVHDQLGQIAAKREDYEAAIGHWRESLRLQPRQPLVQVQLGSALLSTGKMEEARTQLQEAVQLSPNAAPAQAALGECYLQSNEFPLAKAAFLRARELDASLSTAVYGLVRACTGLEQSAEAESYAAEFQQLESKLASADQQLRQQYDDVANLRKSLAQTCVDAGRIYERGTQYDLAESLWAKAIEHDESNLAAREHLARLTLQRGKTERAVAWYEDLVKRVPKNADYQQRLGFAQARLGNYAAAEATLQQAIVVAPQSAAGYRSLAKFYLNTNREPGRARDLAQTAVKLDPVADSYFVLGWAQAKSGQLPAAQSALREAIRLDPGNDTYRQLLQQLTRRK